MNTDQQKPKVSRGESEQRGFSPFPRFPLSHFLPCGLLAALCFLLLAGCTTTPPATQQRVASAAKVAAYIGTEEFLAAHPETRPGFEAARDSLRVLETSEHVDLATLLAIVRRLPVQELKSERAVLIITTATILLSDYAGSLPVEKLDDLKPVAKAIREGIELGLH